MGTRDKSTFFNTVWYLLPGSVKWKIIQIITVNKVLIVTTAGVGILIQWHLYKYSKKSDKIPMKKLSIIIADEQNKTCWFLLG